MWSTLPPPCTDGTMKMSLTTLTPAATDQRGGRFHERHYIPPIRALDMAVSRCLPLSQKVENVAMTAPSGSNAKGHAQFANTV